MDVARRFYEELFPRFCPGTGQIAAWEPTNIAFEQLISTVSVLQANALRSKNTSEYIELLGDRYVPFELDADATKKLCGQMNLAERGLL